MKKLNVNLFLLRRNNRTIYNFKFNDINILVVLYIYMRWKGKKEFQIFETSAAKLKLIILFYFVIILFLSEFF